MGRVMSGRIGSGWATNSPSWIGRVGSGPMSIISNKYAIYIQEICRLQCLMIRSCNSVIFITVNYLRVASEEVILNLISAKCIPCLLYASEALPFNSSQLKSLGFPLKRILFKMLWVF